MIRKEIHYNADSKKWMIVKKATYDVMNSNKIICSLQLKATLYNVRKTLQNEKNVVWMEEKV